jgi:hypothetical protein
MPTSDAGDHLAPPAELPERSANRPQPPARKSVRRRKDLPAYVISGVIVALIVLMMATTGGYLTRAQWVLLYVGIALVTGVLFWTITTSEAEFTATKLGIKLGGGAAIGACFMALANRITAESASSVIIPLATEDALLGPRIIETDPGVAPEILNDKRRVLTEFRTAKGKGWFIIKALSDDAKGWRWVKYDVTAEGKVERTLQER